MKKAIRKLLEISGSAFIDVPSGVGIIPKELGLYPLLSEKNGFFAFESALRIFPTEDSPFSYGLSDWNSPGLWRDSYGELTEGLFFFAEDIFGTQFCLKNEAIYSFDPETADLSKFADDIESWAETILSDYDVLTGYSLAHAWQAENGPLAPRDRLMPKLPFVCGGAFDSKNLSAIDAARSMRCRGNLAKQINTLPDGAQIKFELVD